MDPLEEFRLLEEKVADLIGELKRERSETKRLRGELAVLKENYERVKADVESKVASLIAENNELKSRTSTNVERDREIKSRVSEIVDRINAMTDDALAPEASETPETESQPHDRPAARISAAPEVPHATNNEQPINDVEGEIVAGDVIDEEGDALFDDEEDVDDETEGFDFDAPDSDEPQPTTTETAPPQDITAASDDEVFDLTDEEDPFSAATDDAWDVSAGTKQGAQTESDDDEYALDYSDDDSDDFYDPNDENA